MPLFSIFIPVRNDANWLGGAIESVLSQELQDWELVIGDNASDESVQHVAARFSDPRIRYHRFDDLVDVVHNFNRTAAITIGEWVVALGADDRLMPGALFAFGDAIRERPDLAMVVAECTRVDDAGRPASKTWRFYQRRIDVAAGDYGLSRWARAVAAEGQPAWNIGSIAIAADALGPGRVYFDVEAGPGSDTELVLRMAAAGPIRFVDQVVLLCTERQDSDQRGQWLRNRSGEMEETVLGRGLRVGLATIERRRGTLKRATRDAILASIARTYVQRAAHHRMLPGGGGRAGAWQDVRRAWRTSPRGVLAPRQLVYSAGALLSPLWVLRLADRALRQESQ